MRARILTPWGTATPLSIPQQMLARVQRAMEENREIHVIGCIIERGDNGYYNYLVTNSPMPGEIAWMAAYEVSRSMRPR